MRLFPITAFVTAWMFVQGCSSDPAGTDASSDAAADTDAPSTPNEDFIEYELFETTRLLTGEVLQSLVSLSPDGTLTFASGAALPAEMAPGNVLILGESEATPAGMLAEVVEIQTTGAGIEIKTKPAPIQKAFRKLNVSFKRPLQLDINKIDWEPGVTMLKVPDSKADGFDASFGPYSLEYYPFNGDGDTGTPEDQVYMKATFGGGLGYWIGIEFEWPEVWELDFLPEVKAGFRVYAEAEADIWAEGVAAKVFEKEYKLGHVDLPKFWVGPLLFFPSIDFKAKLEGGASSRYTMNLGASASFEAEASYSTDDGGTLIPPDPSFDSWGPTVTAMEQAYAKFSMGPRVKLLLYGVVGPYASIWAYAKINATSDQDPCWAVHGGFEGDIGIQLELWGYDIGNWGTTYDIFDLKFAEGSCLDDPNTPEVPDVTEPTFTPWNKRFNNGVVSWDLDRSATFITQSVDGAWLTGGDGTPWLTKLNSDGEPLWSRSFTRTNAVLPVPLRVTHATPAKDTGIWAAGHTPTVLLFLDNNGHLVNAQKPDLEFNSSFGPADMLVLQDGSTIVATPVILQDMGNDDVWLTRLAADGKSIWSIRWGRDDRREWPTALARVDNDFVVVGSTFSASEEPSRRGFMLRITEAGQLVWAVELLACDVLNALGLRAALQSMDGDIIAGGSYGLGGPQEVLVKIKPDGSLGWANVNSVNFLGIELTDFAQLTDGGYLAVGTWWTASQDDIWIARMDSVGRMFWLKRLDDTVSNNAPSLAMTGQGGALYAAYSEMGGSGDSSLWLGRFPVKTGDFSYVAPDISATEGAYTLNEGMCLNVIQSSETISDFPISWQQDPITEESRDISVSNLTK